MSKRTLMPKRKTIRRFTRIFLFLFVAVWLWMGWHFWLSTVFYGPRWTLEAVYPLREDLVVECWENRDDKPQLIARDLEGNRKWKRTLGDMEPWSWGGWDVGDFVGDENHFAVFGIKMGDVNHERLLILNADSGTTRFIRDFPRIVTPEGERNIFHPKCRFFGDFVTLEYKDAMEEKWVEVFHLPQQKLVERIQGGSNPIIRNGWLFVCQNGENWEIITVRREYTFLPPLRRKITHFPLAITDDAWYELDSVNFELLEHALPPDSGFRKYKLAGQPDSAITRALKGMGYQSYERIGFSAAHGKDQYFGWVTIWDDVFRLNPADSTFSVLDFPSLGLSWIPRMENPDRHTRQNLMVAGELPQIIPAVEKPYLDPTREVPQMIFGDVPSMQLLPEKGIPSDFLFSNPLLFSHQGIAYVVMDPNSGGGIILGKFSPVKPQLEKAFRLSGLGYMSDYDYSCASFLNGKFIAQGSKGWALVNLESFEPEFESRGSLRVEEITDSARIWLGLDKLGVRDE